MFSILGLDHVVLRAANVPRMVHFYCQVLGCTLERERPELGLTQLRAGNSLIDLVAVDSDIGRRGGAAPGAEGRNMDHLCLRIEPFDPGALTARLIRHGVVPGIHASGALAERRLEQGFQMITVSGDMLAMRSRMADEYAQARGAAGPAASTAMY